MGPTNAAQSVTGRSEGKNPYDPDRIYEPQSADLGKRNAFECVPEKENADEQAWNSLEEITVAGRSHAVTAYGVTTAQKKVDLYETERNMPFFIVSLKMFDIRTRLSDP
jgi:hypothetical protein